MPQVQSSVRDEDHRTYEDTLLSVPDGFSLGPPLDYFTFEQPIQPNYQYPIPFPQEHSLASPLSAHVAQLYDYTALYNGQQPMDQNLLSSETYPGILYEDEDLMEPGGKDVPLYGELLPISSQGVDEESQASRTKSTRSTRTRKLSKKEDVHSTSPDESNIARQRGRPRLDTRDQTAAERRRTQIRLAQRAYRQRKETTISGLNKRVSELESTIEDMNHSFLDFNDKAIASGIRKWEPSLAQDLKTTMGHFLESARQITEVDEEENEQVPNISARVYGTDDPPPVNTSRTSRRPRLLNRSTGSSSAGEKARAAPWGYDTVNQGQAEIGKSRRSRVESSPNHQMTGMDNAEWSLLKTTDQFRVEIPETALVKRPTDMSVGKSLPMPLTYSTRENSFARRLQRQSLETSFRLMTDPNSSREDIARVCKLTFCFSNSQRVTEHLQRLIGRTAQEDLEVWEGPQLQLRGAGMQYPRFGLDSTDHPLPAWWIAEASTGPQRPVEPETPVSKDLNMKQIVELVGFDGEWFDSNDVDLYLRTKGLYLDGQSSWVEVELPELLPSDTQFPTVGSPTESSMGSSKDPQSPPLAASLLPVDPILEGADYFWDADNFNAADYTDINMDYSSNDFNLSDPKAPDSASLFNPQDFIDPILPDILPTFDTTIKKFIDVEKFINSLINTSVCLGGTPGFRRSAIDSALIKATQNWS